MHVPPPPPPPSRGGHLADRFELKSQAGTGGMGTVYQALDLRTNERVAVKVLHAKGANDAARFTNEAALLAELVHPAIVRYIDSGVTSQGDPFIAMEWLEGETLEDRLSRGPMPPGRVARLGARVLEALALAHDKGVVHRDIKPSNVFLVGWRLSHAKLLDFGIARRVTDPKRLTRQGSTVGTPMYASPEQARGERKLDGRADIFSLACVLFECLTGEPPFTGDTPAAVMARICLGSAPVIGDRLPALDRSMAALVQRMLTQDRNARPGDAAALAREFEKIAGRLDIVDSAGAALVGSANDEVRARDVISESEQRVMAVLMVQLPSKGPAPARGGGPMARTQLMPTAPKDADAETLAALATVVEPFGGRIDRLVDRSLVVTVPHLAYVADQLEQVARLALRLRAAVPDARFAIGTGRGVLLARLPVGDVVEAAAGLIERATRGAIVLDDTSARLLASRFEIQDEPNGRRLGLELINDDTPRRVFGGPTPFFGRDRELASLRALLAECMSEESPRLAVVLGPAGAGKTRLVQELVRRVCTEPGIGRVKVVSSRAVPLRHAPAYLAARRLLALAGVEDPGSLSPGQAREAVRSYFAAQTVDGPLIVVLDELQHADLASIQLLESALAAARDCQVMLIAVARPEAEERFMTFVNERAALRLRLTALSRKSAESMLRRVLPSLKTEAVTWVVGRCDGNPLLLEELSRYCLLPGRDPLPDTVVAHVQSWFDGFGPDLKRLLRAASLLDDVDSEGLVALLGDKHRRELDGWLQLLTDRGVLERASESHVVFRFRSPLYQEAAYQMLAPGDRALGRRLVRSYYEESGRTIPEHLAVGKTGTAFRAPPASEAA